MDIHTPPKAKTVSNSSSPLIPTWMVLIPETRSTSHLEGLADASTQTEGLGTGGRSHALSEAQTSPCMIQRLSETDNEDTGANAVEPKHSASPSRTLSFWTCRSTENDATIRPVTAANGLASLDTPCSSSRPALPMLRRSASMPSLSSSLSHMGAGLDRKTEPSWPELGGRRGFVGYRKRRRNGQDLSEARREFTVTQENKCSFEVERVVEVPDEGLSSKRSFQSTLGHFFKSAAKGFGLQKRFRNLWS
ncbi:hypothetical protein DHEL01_v202227 [Diaporthe helianthi]|uniref:Uncharacterized protein n=1 Tax=Diaporthe helianthi TaxID=158607 RepID=A0A2P5IA32_DIAHE|nr:hypothetical protein DHEL01_v202227 [Diaporthe helianthi]